MIFLFSERLTLDVLQASVDDAPVVDHSQIRGRPLPNLKQWVNLVNCQHDGFKRGVISEKHRETCTDLPAHI